MSMLERMERGCNYLLRHTWTRYPPVSRKKNKNIKMKEKSHRHKTAATGLIDVAVHSLMCCETVLMSSSNGGSRSRVMGQYTEVKFHVFIVCVLKRIANKPRPLTCEI